MKTDEQLLEEIGRAADGLLFMSEADYPLETVRVEGPGEVSPGRLRELAGAAEESPVAIQSPDEFFRAAAAEPDWKDERERAEARRYQALVRLLKENLGDLRVYRVGEINIPVYVLGRSASGNWLGLRTRVVET